MISLPNLPMFSTTNVSCYIMLNKYAIKHLLTSGKLLDDAVIVYCSVTLSIYH